LVEGAVFAVAGECVVVACGVLAWLGMGSGSVWWLVRVG
jgi:hypothetical protein